jgi:hypothetical protein
MAAIVVLLYPLRPWLARLKQRRRDGWLKLSIGGLRLV